jgi:tetratricopeptide (TPR) repeat protein
MEWSALLDSVLRCHPGNEQLHQIILVLGGLASCATIIAALYKGFRWAWPPPPKHGAAAAALRDEGTHRAQLGHLRNAMNLYTLSIRLNPKAGHVYHLRGVLYEMNGDLPQAIADWKRSLERLPDNNPSEQKLAQYAATPVDERSRYRWVYAYGASAIVLLVAMLSILL